MSDNEKELRSRLLKMEHQVDFIAKTISALAKNVKPSKYMDETEVREMLGKRNKPMSIRQLSKLRTEGVLIGYSSTGKNFKYMRTEVEEFIEGHKALEMMHISDKYYRSKKTTQTIKN